MTDPKTGIYGIFRRGTSDCYIGSSLDIHRRWKDHRGMLRARKHYNKKLENAWYKYGEDAFEFRVIELCEEPRLLATEEHWLQIFRPQYNLTFTPTQPINEVIRKQISLSLRGKGRPQAVKDKIKETQRRKNRTILAFGALFSASELAEKLGIKANTLRKRLGRGWKPPQNE